MLRLLADADVHGAIVSGLRYHRPTLDLVRVQDVGLRTASDPDILEYAAKDGRIVLSQDRDTMINFAWNRVEAGLLMPGLFVVRDRAGIGEVIDWLLLADGASTQNEWNNRVELIPL